MTINLALEYIPRRMAELGHRNYHIRFHHLVLQALEKTEIEAYNHIYLLVEEAPDVNISSELGIFDLSLENSNEMQYEHQGLIRLTNYAIVTRHLRFIQIIPSFNSSPHES